MVFIQLYAACTASPSLDLSSLLWQARCYLSRIGATTLDWISCPLRSASYPIDIARLTSELSSRFLHQVFQASRGGKASPNFSSGFVSSSPCLLFLLNIRSRWASSQPVVAVVCWTETSFRRPRSSRRFRVPAAVARTVADQLLCIAPFFFETLSDLSLFWTTTSCMRMSLTASRRIRRSTERHPVSESEKLEPA